MRSLTVTKRKTSTIAMKSTNYKINTEDCTAATKEKLLLVIEIWKILKK